MHRASLVSLLSVLALIGCRGASHLQEANRVETYRLENPDRLGEADGVTLYEGGFSGLAYLGGDRWLAVSDRGPNIEAERRAGQPAKRFLVPSYSPKLFTLRASNGALTIEKAVPIRSFDGDVVSGRPVPQQPAGQQGETRQTALIEEAWADTAGTRLPTDADGIDAEGVALVPGTNMVWVADEYRPSLWLVDRTSGQVQLRFTPTPEAHFERPLPPLFAERVPNLGFEGIAALDDGRVAAVFQQPLQRSRAHLATPIARLVLLDPDTGDAHTWGYALDGPNRKVGDLVALSTVDFLLIEHALRPDGMWSAEVYHLDLDGITPLDDTRGYGPDRLPPEGFSTAEGARRAGVPLVPKRLVLDLVAAGWPKTHEKPEGLAVISLTQIAVLNDNDYGLSDIRADGTFQSTDVPTTLFVFPLDVSLEALTQ